MFAAPACLAVCHGVDSPLSALSAATGCRAAVQLPQAGVLGRVQICTAAESLPLPCSAAVGICRYEQTGG